MTAGPLPPRDPLLPDPARSAAVLDAVRSAAAGASDVLLFHYAGSGARHERFALPGPDSDAQGSAPLRQLAYLVRDSPAARRVVLLDCEHVATAAGYFLRDPGAAGSTSLLGKQPSMYFGSPEARVPTGERWWD